MAMPERDDDRRRAAILGDPKNRAAIRSVLYLRGVPTHDVDDLLQEVGRRRSSTSCVSTP